MSLKSIVIMCNGPSLRGVDLSLLNEVDTFGLNQAYKYYYKHNWWPTYHGCYDYLTNSRYKSKFCKLTLEDNPIKRFFYITNLSNSDRFTHVRLNESQIGWNDSEESFKRFYAFGNSGTNACSTAICMGYNNLILLGADCNQVDEYDGVEIKNGKILFTKTPDHNPNYWFDYYFEKGDIINLPQRETFHSNWWPRLAQKAKENNVRIVNCSDISTLECFEKSTLEKELSLISGDNA